MKHLFTLISILFLYTHVFGQITLKDSNGNDLTNQTAHLPSSPDKVYFNITNEGSEEITFIVEVIDFAIPDDATGLSVCACDQCVQITAVPVTIGQAVSLGAGETYGTNGEADVEYISNGSSEHAFVTIKVYEEGNEDNNATFTLDTDAAFVNEPNTFKFSLYPNPAKDILNVNISANLINPEIKITDIIGKTVECAPLKTQKNQINIAKLNAGIYFVSFISDGKIINTKKLIVK